MASRRCTEVQARPAAFLDVTSVTLDAFPQFVPPCETAFRTHLAAWHLDRKPRIARRFTVYLKTSALQVVQGRLFGMGHSKAHQWMHVLLPTLLAALRALGDAPARSLTALAQRVGVSEADAATVVVPLEEAPAPVVAVPAAASASPLVPMTAPNDASSAPTTLLNRRSVRAAKKDHTVNNVLLVNALLLILFLSDTYGGRVHETPLADMTPSPFPAGSRLVQGLGFLACTLPQVAILMPTTKPPAARS